MGKKTKCKKKVLGIFLLRDVINVIMTQKLTVPPFSDNKQCARACVRACFPEEGGEGPEAGGVSPRRRSSVLAGCPARGGGRAARRSGHRDAAAAPARD